jgi:hypothetical protein
MIRAVLFVSLLLPGMTQAVICKTVDADGVVGYTDVPAGECAERVELPDYSRYEPRPIPQTQNTSARPSTEDSAADRGRFEGYRSIEIVQPEANGTVRSNEGIVPVAIALDPPLVEGHRIKLYIDGGAVRGEFDGPAIDLGGVERGTHSLRAVVSDADGKRIGDSPTVRFTLRQTTLYDRERAEQPPVQPVNPIEPVPQPSAPPPARPESSGTSGYRPDGFSSTPGRTNPAFRPSYSP